MIRENNDIKDIVINNIEHKLSQYADDREFLLYGVGNNLTVGLQLLMMLVENLVCIWMREKLEQFGSVVKYMQHMGIKWNTSKFKILGI